MIDPILPIAEASTLPYALTFIGTLVVALLLFLFQLAGLHGAFVHGRGSESSHFCVAHGEAAGQTLKSGHSTQHTAHSTQHTPRPYKPLLSLAVGFEGFHHQLVPDG